MSMKPVERPVVKGMSVLFESVLEDQLAQLKRKDMGLGGVEACMVVSLTVSFNKDVELPNIWDTSSETVNAVAKMCFSNYSAKKVR